MDRVHRIGQEKPVHVYRLVTKGTVEERIVQRAKKKLFLDSMVNRGSTAQSEMLEGLSKAEMLKMLKFGASAVFGESEGDVAKPLTDEELDAMIDRSPEATQNRQTSQNNSSAVAGDNALDFEIEQGPQMSIREMYTKKLGEGEPAAEEEKPAKRPRSITPTSGPGRKRKDAAAEAEAEVSVQDIAKEWKSLKGTSSSGRKVVSRFTKVGKYNVLKSNTYSLEEGEKSVFASELANRRRGPDAATLEEINRSLGRGRQIAGRDYTNEQHCLACWDGGELVLCDQCPVSAHLECLSEDQAPSTRNGASWRCPHHSCMTCDRKSAAAGGLLFRCSECLHAYCEDHLPLENVRLHEEGRCLRFEQLGFRKTSQGYYILCSKNCQDFFQDRTVLGAEEAIKRAVRRTNGEQVPPVALEPSPSSSSKKKRMKM